ncbi:hypothetical protein ACN9MF_20230 [Methylobacterium fujisawaense]|uniref:hypothetical protein n=1 Tax=Methylobacterium fujisawaense TaxID=107400 RepID=UPI003CF7BD20
MADEALRMQAEVVDRFSGPLKSLRAQLLDTVRTGANHSETLAKGFGAVEGALQKTARTASSVVNPAFAALGVTGLTAGAAVAGISNALNKLNGNLTGLGQLTRDTGIAAKTLQEFGAVAGRFGIEQDAVAQGAKNFATQMRLFARGTGEAFQWVMRQGTDAAGRKAFQDFATDLQHTTDEGERLKKALTFMETIRNPVERGIFAQQFFGNGDIARIADGHLGKVVDLFKKAREKIGVFNPDDIINAEKFDRSISDLKGSMSRFGLLIARELLGPATQFTTWINELVSDQRGDLLKGLREGLQGVKTELAAINWKQAGDDAVAFLKESTSLAGALAKTFHEVAETIHSLRSGNYAEAFAHADGATGPVLPGKETGADGPLRRKLAPRVGDDEIEARQRVEDLKKLRDAAVEAQGHFIGRTQQRLGLLPGSDQAGKDLEAAESRLKTLQGRTPEQRQKDFEASEKLRKSVDSLTDEMKASRGGATVQKQSMDTQGGLFGGATIQSAAFGGGGFRRPGGFGTGGYGGGVNLPEGGSGPGYRGEQGPAGAGAGRSFGGGGRFNPLGSSRPNVPGIPADSDAGRAARALQGGMGRTNARDPEGKGIYRPEYKVGEADLDQRVVNTIAGEVSTRNAEGVDAVINNMMNRVGTKGWGPSRNLLEVARAPGQYAGYRRAADAESELIRSRIRAIASGGVPDNTGGSNSYRAESYYRGAGRNRTWARTSEIGPNVGGNRYGFVRGAPNGPYAPYSEDVVARRREPIRTAEQADGAGWAAREAARKTFESQQAEAAGLRAGGARVAASAARAGVVAMPSLEANGSVVVNVHRAAPDTRVATKTSGNLFQDVVQRSGAQMRRAD